MPIVKILGVSLRQYGVSSMAAVSWFYAAGARRKTGATPGGVAWPIVERGWWMPRDMLSFAAMELYVRTARRLPYVPRGNTDAIG